MDHIPHVRRAGLVAASETESVAKCVQPDLDPRNTTIKDTPREITKYRKSYQHTPGQRFIHTGLVDAPIPGAHVRHGIQTSKGDRAGDTFQQTPTSELAEFMQEQKESIYRSHIREPLGSAYIRGHVLPQREDDFRYGVQTLSSESAKNLIYFPSGTHAANASSQPLVKSTTRAAVEGIASDDPSSLKEEIKRQLQAEKQVTCQLDRGYNWDAAKIDPANHRFGKVFVDTRDENTGHMSSVAQSIKYFTEQPTHITSVRVEQVKQAQDDRLGKTRNIRGSIRDLPPDFTFGSRPTSDPTTAKELLRGDYPLDQQAPDADLGVSTKIGKDALPHTASDRTFGVPTIRYDRRPPNIKSVANDLNYGDESDGKGLLYPPNFAHEGIHDEDFLVERKPIEIRRIFQRAGHDFRDREFDRICQLAMDTYGTLSVDSFRHAWNTCRQESRCNTCSAVLCTHELCRIMPCQHDERINHAPAHQPSVINIRGVTGRNIISPPSREKERERERELERATSRYY